MVKLKKYNKLISLCFLQLCLLTSNAYSTFTPSTPNYIFSPSQYRDEIAQNTIRQTFKDKDGFIWLATQGGLTRLNGNNTYNYTSNIENEQSISSDNVISISQDLQTEEMWVVTYSEGINLINPDGESFTRFSLPQNKISDKNSIWNVLHDSKGMLWLGFDGGGLICFDTHEKNYSNCSSKSLSLILNENTILASIEDHHGNIWFGTDGNGLIKYTPLSKETQHFTLKQHKSSSPPPLIVSSIMEDNQGNIWISGENASMFMLTSNYENLIKISSDEIVSKGVIRDIHQDFDGVIWLATESGLAFYDKEKKAFVPYPKQNNAMDGAMVLDIYQDPDGTLWIGCFNSLFLGSKNSFYTINKDQGLADNLVFGFGESIDKTTWIGSYQSVQIQEDGAPKPRPIQEIFGYPISSKRIMTLYSHKDTIWIGTRSDGLEVIDLANERVTLYVHNKAKRGSISSNSITSIFVDSLENTWVGTYGGGLNLMPKGSTEFTVFQHDVNDKNSLSSDRVFVIYEDSSGDIWIGTDNEISRYNEDGSFSRFPILYDGKKLSNSFVTSIQEDKNLNLWVTLQDSMLVIWPPTDRKQGINNFKLVSRETGLDDKQLYSMISDDQGYLWVGSNKGLTRINPDNLTFRHFDKSHGLQDNDFNFASSYRNSSGELFFGGSKGYNRFTPSQLISNKKMAPVVLTGVYRLNKKQKFKEPPHKISHLTFNYLDYLLSFDFSALEYHSPKRVQYRYKLDRFDSDWVEIGNQHRATFTNLPAGNYTLLVQATRTNGVWDSPPMTLDITITPPPWRTWWAYTLYALMLGFIVWHFWQKQRAKTRLAYEQKQALEREVAARTDDLVQLNQQLGHTVEELNDAKERAEEANQSKTAFLANISHEIRTPMNSVLGMTELLLRSPLSEQQRRFAITTHRSGEMLLGLINNLLDYSKIEAGKVELEQLQFDIKQLVSETCYLFADQAQRKGLEINYIVDHRLPELVIGDANRLRQILANLVSNAVKFTQEGEVDVVLTQELEGIRISVKDSGIGMTPEALDHVFDAFSQADVSTTRRFGGTGLGLSICKQLVELMKGELFVESTPDQGSCFSILMPLVNVNNGPTSGNYLAIRGDVRTALCSPGVEAMVSSQLALLGIHARPVGETPLLAALLEPGSENCVIADIQLLRREEIQMLSGLPTQTQRRLILLTPIATEQLSDELRHCQRLTKPIDGRTLHIALSIATNQPIPGQQGMTSFRDNSDVMNRFNASIMVAEDTFANQEVLRAMLEMMGCKVFIASDGREAVSMFKQHPVDLVLMDWQMPRLNGYEAAKQIRQFEVETDKPATPILVVTAGMMDTERQRCLQGGMNGYLTKPLTLRQLYDALEEFLPAELHSHEQIMSAAPAGAIQQNDSDDVVDMAAINNIRQIQQETGSDILNRVFSAFKEEVANKLSELRQALNNRDRQQIAACAHAIKSLSSNVGAKRLKQLSHQIELTARDGDLASCKALLVGLEECYLQAIDALSDVIRTP
ncbi:hybrid sensor histidine kinase/response regulator [Corallincola spongiicola]|uniref:histidine kinase n=1 Tax=Corallincola spongiicola TaxID=2520508 RepID=A0ABY1WPD6_9GAMM|nr:hybrid sensor histidine kinase/response regulator [Corallincola spongiicola]TAA45930.1 hybrid sensor histidine kinase/response regulator [Corallincola spongiicola]